MKYWCFFLLSAILLATEWSGYVSHSSNQSTESIALTHPTEYTQQYKPPSRGIPGRRDGGATR
jgi:hypothetical protein